MTNRLVQLLLALVGVLFISAILCVGTLLIVSSGDPVDYLQTALIRLRIAGQEADLDRALGTDTAPLRFTIAPGDTPRIVAANLVAAGLIDDPELFVDFVRVEGLDRRLEAGVYFLTRAETPRQIAYALTDSRAGQFTFRILEGWRMEEIAAVIDQNPYFGFTGADFLRVVGVGSTPDPVFAAYVGLPTGAALEGFLFPNTYTLPAEITPEGLRDFLTTEFMAQVTPDLQAQAAAQGLTLYEAVTLASIIQREAVHTDEHTMISSVYRNRLAIGMKLDADPTVQYAIGYRGERWWPQITQADYTAIVSPFNTYLNIGLPPTPIASPGLSAIRAAILPEASEYYFFRAECSGNGYHRFARTYDEHLANGCP